MTISSNTVKIKKHQKPSTVKDQRVQAQATLRKTRKGRRDVWIMREEA